MHGPIILVGFSELQAKHEKKMQSQRDELELRRKTEVHEVEEVHMYDDSYYTCSLIVLLYTITPVHSTISEGLEIIHRDQSILYIPLTTSK